MTIANAPFTSFTSLIKILKKNNFKSSLKMDVPSFILSSASAFGDTGRPLPVNLSVTGTGGGPSPPPAPSSYIFAQFNYNEYTNTPGGAGPIYQLSLNDTSSYASGFTNSFTSVVYDGGDAAQFKIDMLVGIYEATPGAPVAAGILFYGINDVFDPFYPEGIWNMPPNGSTTTGLGINQNVITQVVTLNPGDELKFYVQDTTGLPNTVYSIAGPGYSYATNSSSITITQVS